MNSPSWPQWLPKHLLTVREVAEVLRISERQVRRFIRERRLSIVRVGRRVLIKPESVIELLGQD